MSDEFVRKDVYESHMAEIRSLIAESEKHYRMMSEAAEARSQAQIAEIRGEVRELRAVSDMTNKRIDDLIERDNAMNRRFDRFVNYIGIVVTACGAIVAGVQLYLAFKG